MPDEQQVAVVPEAVKNQLLDSESLTAVISDKASVTQAQAQAIKQDIAVAASQAVQVSGTRLDAAVKRDPWLLRIVLSSLSATLLTCLGGSIWLQSRNAQIPQILAVLGTGALAGLTALVSPSNK